MRLSQTASRVRRKLACLLNMRSQPEPEIFAWRVMPLESRFMLDADGIAPDVPVDDMYLFDPPAAMIGTSAAPITLSFNVGSAQSVQTLLTLGPGEHSIELSIDAMNVGRLQASFQDLPTGSIAPGNVKLVDSAGRQILLSSSDGYERASLDVHLTPSGLNYTLDVVNDSTSSIDVLLRFDQTARPVVQRSGNVDVSGIQIQGSALDIDRGHFSSLARYEFAALVDANDDSLHIFASNSDGSLTEINVISLGSSVLDIAVADFDGDGTDEVAVLSESSIRIFDNLLDPTGRAGAFSFVEVATAGAMPNSSFAAGRIDGNDTLDLAVISSNGISTEAFAILDPLGQRLTQLIPNQHAEEQLMLGVNERRLFVLTLSPDRTLARLSELSWSISGFLDVADSGLVDVDFREVSGAAVISQTAEMRFENFSHLADQPVVITPGRYLQPVWSIAGLAPVHLSYSHSIGEYYDMDGNGRVDLLNNSLGVALNFLGRGIERDFIYQQPPQPYPPATAIEPGDFNGDGRADVIAAVQRDGQFYIESVLGTSPLHFQYEQAQTLLPFLNSVEIADFNNDHIPDLVSIARGGRTDLLMGNGDGTLQSRVAIEGLTAENSPFGYYSNIEVGDFNGDGRQDIAIVVKTGNSGTANDYGLYVFRGLGDGTFLRVPRHANLNLDDDGIAHVHATDLNADGIVDFTVTYGNSNGQLVVDVFDGKTFFGATGTGTVIPVVSFGGQNFEALRGPHGFKSMASGQFVGTKAGHSDLVLAVETVNGSRIYQLKNNGNFNFALTLAGTTPSGLNLANFQITDLDGDLLSEVLVLHTGGLLIGRPNTLVEVYTSASNLAGLTVGDLNGDSRPDIAMVSDQSAQFIIGIQANAATFSFSSMTSPGLGQFNVVLARDMTSDGRNDLVLIDQASGRIEVVTLPLLSTPVQPPPVAPIQSIGADLTGDGVIDFVSVDESGRLLFRPGKVTSSNRLSIGSEEDLLGTLGLAQFRVVQVKAIGEIGHKSLLVALQADTAWRVVILSYDTGAKAWQQSMPSLFDGNQRALIGTGQSEFAIFETATGAARIFNFAGDVLASISGTQTLPNATDVALIDGNLAILDRRGSTLSIIQPDGVHLATQRAGAAIIVDSADMLLSLDGAVDFQTRDIDLDGYLDILVTHTGSESVSILFGTRQGLFHNPRTIQLPHGVLSATLGDFDGDGLLDLAVLMDDQQSGYYDVDVDLANNRWGFETRDENILVLYQQPDHSFAHTHSSIFTAGVAASTIAAADVNGDALGDLIVGSRYGDVVALLGAGQRGSPFVRSLDNSSSNIRLPFYRASIEIVQPSPSAFRVTLGVSGTDNSDLQAATSAPLSGHVNVRDISGLLANAASDRSASNDAVSNQSGPDNVKFIDLNGDQIDDLIYTNSAANQISVIRGSLINNRPNYTVEPVNTYTVGSSPRGFALQDINGDGYFDIVVANEGSKDLSVLFGGAQGDWINFNSPGQRLELANFVDPSNTSASLNASYASLVPVDVAFSDATANADLLVSFANANDTSTILGSALVRSVGDGFFNDQNVIGSPTENVVDIAFVNSNAFLLLNNGVLRQFDFAGVNRQIGSVVGASFVKQITVNSAAFVGVASASSLTVFDLNGKLVAEADIGLVTALNDFVFYEPTNLLYLVDAMERITARELTFIVENFDRGGVFAKNNSSASQKGDQISAILETLSDATHSSYFVSYGMQHSQLFSIFKSLEAFDQLGVFVNEAYEFFEAFNRLYSDLSGWASSTKDVLAQDMPGLYFSMEFFAKFSEILPRQASFNFLAISHSLYTNWADGLEDSLEPEGPKSGLQKWRELLLTVQAELKEAGQNAVANFDFENNTIVIDGVIYAPSNEAIQQYLLLQGGEQSDLQLDDFFLRPVPIDETKVDPREQPPTTIPAEPETK